MGVFSYVLHMPVSDHFSCRDRNWTTFLCGIPEVVTGDKTGVGPSGDKLGRRSLTVGVFVGVFSDRVCPRDDRASWPTPRDCTEVATSRRGGTPGKDVNGFPNPLDKRAGRLLSSLTRGPRGDIQPKEMNWDTALFKMRDFYFFLFNNF